MHSSNAFRSHYVVSCRPSDALRNAQKLDRKLAKHALCDPRSPDGALATCRSDSSVQRPNNMRPMWTACARSFLGTVLVSTFCALALRAAYHYGAASQPVRLQTQRRALLRYGAAAGRTAGHHRTPV